MFRDKFRVQVFVLVLLALLVLPESVISKSRDDLELPDLKKLREMNGIDPKDYDRFWEKWPLVTTRWRPDKGEQRFVYANKLAYETMKSGVLEFPDGAAFGKVAFISEEDAQFPNSFEPTNFTRMQIMVKDQKKYADLDMDDWSYYIYKDGVEYIPKEDLSNAQACHACHRLVANRDYVFASPTFLGQKALRYSGLGKKFKNKFKAKDYDQLSKLSKTVLNFLPEKPEEVKVLKMRLFSGSLYESIGPLSSYSEKDMPYLLLDPKHKRFLLASPLGPGDGCSNRVLIYMDGRRIKKKGEQIVGRRYIRKGIVCDGKNNWVKKIKLPEDLKL